MPSSILHTLFWSSGGLRVGTRKESSRNRTGEVTERAFAGVVDWKREDGPQKGDVHLAIPAPECFVGIADFPSADAAELAGMVGLRIEEVSPFPMDRTYYGWEPLSQSENSSRVLYALCPRGSLDRRHDALLAAGVTLQRADLDLAAWIGMLQREESGGESSLCLLRQEGFHWLIAMDQGVPAAISAPGVRDGDDSEFFEQLDLSLAALEGERGGLDYTGLVCWSEDGMDDEVLRRLEAHVGLPVRQRLLSEIPSLAEALLRRARESATEPKLDLAPPAWRQEAATRKARKRLLQSLAGLAGFWLLLTLSLLGFVRIRAQHLQKLRQELAAQEASVLEIRDLTGRVRSLTQFTDRRTSVLEVLRILAEASPGSGRMLLRDIQYRKQEGFTLAGEAAGDFFLFQETLSESPVLRVVDFDTREVRGTTEFRMTARWRWEGDEE